MLQVFRSLHLKRVCAILSMIAAWGMMGGHWVIPQAYAWGTMLVNYSSNSTIYKAAVDTFSGKRPCKMCRQIQAKKADQKSNPITLDQLRADPAIVPQAETNPLELAALSETCRAFPTSDALFSICSAPPTPPPRLS